MSWRPWKTVSQNTVVWFMNLQDWEGKFGANDRRDVLQYTYFNLGYLKMFQTQLCFFCFVFVKKWFYEQSVLWFCFPLPLFRPWKFEHIGIGLLSLLLRDDRVLPLRAIRFFIENLNHDAIVVRKVDILFQLQSWVWEFLLHVKRLNSSQTRHT